jgi:zinc protease
MELLSDTLLRPSFPEEEVDRLRTQRLAAIQQRQMDPGSQADDAANHEIYSDASPYHRPLAGTQASVEGLTSSHIRDFVRANYTPGGSALVVVGDVEGSEVRAMAKDHFGEWNGESRTGIPLVTEPRSSGGKVVIVHRPGAVQSEIRMGQVGVPRDTPHFFPLKVFNTVLGGAFTSRLMLNLREDKGYTYGVRSSFALRRGPGPFGISMAVATEVTAPAVEAALGELGGLLVHGPKEGEVDRARDYIAGTFPLHLETTGQLAARIAELKVYGLPDDFFGTYRDRIREVGVAQAHRAGREVLDPEALVVVVVGDAEAVQGPLGELGIGPVEVVSQL